MPANPAPKSLDGPETASGDDGRANVETPVQGPGLMINAGLKVCADHEIGSLLRKISGC